MRRWCTAAATAPLAVAGCGGNDEDRVSLVPVSGTLTLDGKPLEGTIITFVPDSSNKDKTDGGDVTGSGGAFDAKYRNRKGLAPGKYKVVVPRPGSGPGAAAKGPGLPEDITKSAYMSDLASAGGTSSPGSPAKKAPPPWLYGTAEKSPLSHEVTAKGDSGLTFDLKSALK